MRADRIPAGKIRNPKKPKTRFQPGKSVFPVRSKYPIRSGFFPILSSSFKFKEYLVQKLSHKKGRKIIHYNLPQETGVFFLDAKFYDASTKEFEIGSENLAQFSQLFKQTDSFRAQLAAAIDTLKRCIKATAVEVRRGSKATMVDLLSFDDHFVARGVRRFVQTLEHECYFRKMEFRNGHLILYKNESGKLLDAKVVNCSLT
jgi:hypothetical protein